MNFVNEAGDVERGPCRAIPGDHGIELRLWGTGWTGVWQNHWAILCNWRRKDL